jgi:hypothetical protein
MLAVYGFSQDNGSGDFTKNKVKLNLFGLPLKNISVQYERGLTEDISVCLGIRVQPKGDLPFKNSISRAIGDEDTTANDLVDNAKASSWAITPEFRYYFGKRPLSGFYIAPYARIGGNSLEWSYAFRKDDGTMKGMDFSGKVNSIYGGLLLGAQWHLGKGFLIDWWILGPSYGSMKITLNADGDMTDLSAEDRQDIEDALNGIGYNGHEVETKISDNGVKVTGKLPMFGLRMGLCIGYTF